MTLLEHMFATDTTDEHSLWPAGVVVRHVSWAGCRFDAVVTLDHEEIARRSAHGLGALSSHHVLLALSSLPAGLKIPWVGIDHVLATFVRSLPRGLVEWDEEGVTRIVRPTVESAVAVKRLRSWESSGAVGALTRLVPVSLVLQRKPRALREVSETARKARVGLGYETVDGVVPLVRPGRTERPGLSRDRLLEVLFQAWSRQTATTPAMNSHALSCLDGG